MNTHINSSTTLEKPASIILAPTLGEPDENARILLRCTHEHHQLGYAEKDAALPSVGLSVHSQTLSDVDEQARSLSGWTQEYQQLSCGKYAGAVTSVVLPDVELIVESSNLQLHQTGEVPKDTIVLAIALNAGGEGWLSGKKFDDNTLIVLAHGHELDFRTPPDLTAAALVVDANALSHYLHTFDINASFDIAVKNRFAALPPSLINTLRDYVRSAITNIHSGDINLSHPASIKAFRAGLISNFVHVLGGLNPANQAIPRSALQRRRTVNKAIEYIRSHINEPICIIDVCYALNVEQRVLQYCFQEVLGLAPISYLKYLRLIQVRRELRLAGSSHCDIGDAAAHWGFWHLSRFSSDYRKLFGELPSETVRRARM